MNGRLMDAGENEGQEPPRRLGITEIDMVGGGQEERDHESSQQIDESSGLYAIEIGLKQWRQEHRGHPHDPRQSRHGQFRKDLTGLAGERGRKMGVVTQLLRGVHQNPNEKVLEGGSVVENVTHFGEELFDTPDS